MQWSSKYFPKSWHVCLVNMKILSEIWNLCYLTNEKNRFLKILSRAGYRVDFGHMLIFLFGMVWTLPLISYNTVSLREVALHKLEVQQKKAIRHAKTPRYNAHTGDHFKQLEYLQIRDLISFNQAIFARKYIPMASCLLPSIACSLQFLSRVAEGSGMTIIISFQCQYPMLTCTTFPLNR